MATNAAGWPYPVGTDKVVDGDNAIKALADQLMANIVVGRINGALDARGEYTVSSIRAGETRTPKAVMLTVFGDDANIGAFIVGMQPVCRTMAVNSFTARIWNTQSGFPLPTATVVLIDWVAFF
jgi:hypothetical protein